MKMLVVYDSVFGNTGQVARAIGNAAKPISDRLRKKGGELIIAPEGFFVKDVEGPLKEGELERVAAWAKKITAIL